METLSEAMNRLQKEGYNSNITKEEMLDLDPGDWQIDHTCRFEGMSNPDDNSILYAISKKDGSRKLLIVNAYGVYNDEVIYKFMEQVKPV
ncbi:hypothetical protein BH11BAC7_BH11BAC7_34840 [soil metagenome]